MEDKEPFPESIAHLCETLHDCYQCGRNNAVNIEDEVLAAYLIGRAEGYDAAKEDSGAKNRSE